MSIWYRSFSPSSDSIFHVLPLKNLIYYFLQEAFIQCMINNILVLLLTDKFISSCGILPTVLSSPTRIIRTKVHQDLELIWQIPGDMYKTCGFWYILQIIYIYFPALDRDLTNIRVIIRQDGFYSNFLAVTIMVVICPSRFVIRRFYYNLVNKLYNLNAFKHINSRFKINIFTIKYLNIRLLAPTVGKTFQQNSI